MRLCHRSLQEFACSETFEGSQGAEPRVQRGNERGRPPCPPNPGLSRRAVGTGLAVAHWKGGRWHEPRLGGLPPCWSEPFLAHRGTVPQSAPVTLPGGKSSPGRRDSQPLRTFHLSFVFLWHNRSRFGHYCACPLRSLTPGEPSMAALPSDSSAATYPMALVCPECHGPLTAKLVCWACCDRLCCACGRQTGSAFFAVCLACEASALDVGSGDEP
jgi:hypothetical protein